MLGEGGFGKVLLVKRAPESLLEEMNRRKLKNESEGKECPQIDPWTNSELFAMKLMLKRHIVETGNVAKALSEKDILQHVVTFLF